MSYQANRPGERGILTETYDLRPTGYLGTTGAPRPSGFPASPGRESLMGYVTMGDDVSFPLITRQRAAFSPALNPRLTASTLKSRVTTRPLSLPGSIRTAATALTRGNTRVSARRPTKVSASRPRVVIMEPLSPRTAQPIAEPYAQPVAPSSASMPPASRNIMTAPPPPTSFPEADLIDLGPQAIPAAPAESKGSSRLILWGALAAGAAALYYMYGRKP